jgi:hypothetical protein
VLTRDTRVRLFLAVLILVLVLVNSQSLQFSYQSRALLTELFELSTRDATARLTAEFELRLPIAADNLNRYLEEVATARAFGYHVLTPAESAVWDQTENRLPVQTTILYLLMGAF